jgi:histidinol dehydrogenase
MKIINYSDFKEEKFEYLSEIEETVKTIVKNVSENGNRALLEYTNKFDCPSIDKDSMKVTAQEIEEALQNVDKQFFSSLEKAYENIKIFHEKQKKESWFTYNNGMVGQIVKPLKRVGIYTPGGKAAYPSSVLMNAVPAIVAGVSEIVMVSPAGKDGKLNPYVLAAAKICSITEIYKVGGAQAVAALAYGTETIAKVDKIVGPGNAYVALAKKSVYGQVDIDMIAGPSEIIILADSTAIPKFVAADLISQAEHDELARSILITTDKELSEKVLAELKAQIEINPRKEIINKSLDNRGGIVLVNTIEEGIEIVNKIAPEHFELCVSEPMSYLDKIETAGAIFLGNYSPEPVGDYIAGPNHVLPTGGTAKFFSPLNLDDFVKKSSFIYYNRENLENVYNDVITLAEGEGLYGHANSVRVRFEE